MTDERSALIEAVAQEDRYAALKEAEGIYLANSDVLSERDRDIITRNLAQAFARHRQAAIASVIAHATSDEALERATRYLVMHKAMEPDVAKEAAKWCILAALNERQS